ncbi:DUF6456 domain-containing protein [Pseudoruegeria sp. HB172150]|uniref:DUF6456 domain-containing protein n=1 Tax=Pseudoruegeria sp. HB172150 TaxID=2721164 RepID=UPI001556C78C|nr:DUF6456 domain-containing protein [Pseudoruegeria sp. HB172150]
MTADIANVSETLFPSWVPTHVRHYVVHTECGESIRALARNAGCHASTVMRQVRRNETRRDDPLVDKAITRLAAVVRHPPTREHEDSQNMKMDYRIESCELPEADRIDDEARRVLRLLAEPDAILAVAPGMEKAVVVREMSDGRNVRTAVLDAEIAEAFALKDWIAGKRKGRIARYRISPVGRSALKRLEAEQAGTSGVFSEAPSIFGEQHRACDTEGDRRRGRRVLYNANESPLVALSRRRDKEGHPFLSTELVRAGERLREDFELAQLGPRVAQNWDRFLTGTDHASFRSGTELGHGSEAARDRVSNALKELGPGLGDVALRCCCFLEGMEQAEKRMGWSARSGKIVLKIALQRLKHHYEGLGSAASLIG